MPMDEDELAELQSLIQVARKRDVNFAVCMGKKPEGTIFYMHRKKDFGILARLAKKAGETAKLAFGTCSVKGKILKLGCEEDPPTAMARHMKLFLKENGMPFKVAILDRYGEEIESSGDEDEEELEATGAAPGPEEDENAAAAKKWRALVAKVDPIYVAAMGTNPPNRTQLEAAWVTALEKAEAQDFETATKIVARILPTLQATADTSEEAAPDPMEAQWIRIADEIAKLYDAAMKTNPPNRTQLEAAWAMATEKAEAEDYATAMKIVERLRPNLEAVAETAEQEAGPGGPEAAAWASRKSVMEELYTNAMKTNPPDASKFSAAWAMATEKADGGDYASATKIADRLEPLLRTAIAARGAPGTEDIPTNVVAFQRSRIEWIDTRRTMMSEMKKLEGAISAVCGGNPDLAQIVSQVTSLSERLNAFDTQLEDILEQITVTPEGDARSALKRDAQAKIAEYQNTLNSDFFNDVDTNNGFANVNVASAAKEKLGTISKALAG